ncbi:hypothetical protein D9M68_472690 [compost metagenome]
MGGGAAVALRLAADQIVGLDGGGALIDGQDARVAVKLRRAGFFDESHAAVHLDAQRRDLDRVLGRETLDDGHQVFVEGAVTGALFRVRVMRTLVVGGRGHIGNGARRLRQRLHRHQHALHVRMAHDGHGPRGTFHGPALHALARVGQGVLVCALGHPDALLPH